MYASPIVQELNALIETEQQSLVIYIRSIVRDAAIAEDLTQDTILRAHLGISGLKDRTRLIPWLYKIATNICRD